MTLSLALETLRMARLHAPMFSAGECPIGERQAGGNGCRHGNRGRCHSFKSSGTTISNGTALWGAGAEGKSRKRAGRWSEGNRSPHNATNGRGAEGSF
jgi:hypothetical protein